MKHPGLNVLQDYFEAETESLQIKSHLEECDRCSRIISEMAKVDIYFSRDKSTEVSSEVKEKVFTNASKLLIARRKTITAGLEKKRSRQEKSERVLQKISKLRSDALSELKLPIMQSAALAMAILVFTKVSTTHTKTEYYNIIDNDIQVLDAEAQKDDVIGEDNEIN
jgi:hypothetical protein